MRKSLCNKGPYGVVYPSNLSTLQRETETQVVAALLYGVMLSDSVFMLDEPNQVFPQTLNPYSVIVSPPYSVHVNILGIWHDIAWHLSTVVTSFVLNSLA